MALDRMRSTLFCLAVMALMGCQALAASLTSPSDWIAGSVTAIGGSLEAISRSSGSGTGGRAIAPYRRDVRAWTAEVAQHGITQEEFLRGVGRIAESYGPTHWAAEPATLLAIGEGLSDAGWTSEEMEQLRAALAEVPATDVELVFDGYRQPGS